MVAVPSSGRQVHSALYLVNVEQLEQLVTESFLWSLGLDRWGSERVAGERGLGRAGLVCQSMYLTPQRRGWERVRGRPWP